MVQSERVRSVPELHEGQCQIWWAKPEAVSPWCRRLLNADELRRADEYRRDVDRNRFTVGCTITRLVVGALTETPAGEVRLQRHCANCGSPHGRLRLPGDELFLSVSHSGTWVAVAVTGAGPVGIDVAYCDPTLIGMASQVLSGRELGEFERLSAADQVGAFYTYWVRKEAILKATGDGLRVPMTAVHVSGFQQPPVLESFDARPGTALWLEDLHVDEEHTAAISASRSVAITALDASALLEQGRDDLAPEGRC